MTKLLLLDKDGTIVRPKSGAKFVQHPEDQKLIPGVADAIARYVADGWNIAIVSNQGGVAAGHKTIDDAIAEMRFACELIGCYRGYFCPVPVTVDGDCCISVGQRGDTNTWGYLVRNRENQFMGFRKPNPGMLQLAIDDCARKVTNVLMIGDRAEDAEAAAAAGVPFLHVDQWLDRAPF